MATPARTSASAIAATRAASACRSAGATSTASSQNENGFGYEPKDHGFDNRHLTASGDVRVGTQALTAKLVRSEGDVEFAGGESDFTQQAAVVALEGPIGARWTHRLSAGNAREDYETPVYFTAYASRRTSFTWQGNLALGERQLLTVGVDHLRERGENRDTFANLPVYRESRDDTGLYAGWRGSFGALDGELAIRHDDNSEWHGQTPARRRSAGASPALRVVCQPRPGFRRVESQRAVLAGLRRPVRRQSDLRPETPRSSELGVDFARRKATSSASAPT